MAAIGSQMRVTASPFFSTKPGEGAGGFPLATPLLLSLWIKLRSRVVRPFCRAIQFTDAENFSAYNFLGWIHHSIYGVASQRLAGYNGARDEAIFQPLARYLTQRGVTIRTSAKLEQIHYDFGNRFSSIPST